MQHPCQLRFLFTRDTDTSLYTALKIGKWSEAGREKRVMPEFGEYWRRKIIPLKFKALQTYPLKRISPSRFKVGQQRVRVLGHQIIFTLPSCFFLRVVTPPNFAHSDSVPPGDPICSLKNLRWLLYVGQVFLDF
jgi:hypothetical protein